MTDPRLEKLASVLVNYSLKIRPGDKLSIEAPDVAAPLVRAVYREALRAGASGFLLKRAPAEDLVAGIRIVAAGDALLAPSITRRLLSHFATPPKPRSEDVSLLIRLTQREREVFELVAQGLSNSEIAERLFLTEGTVKTHVNHIFEKLEVRDRTQAVIFAYDVGLVKPRTS